jgi:gamma-glutamylcyclotransferase (GGCT)/AIG2-like uncharacterized protein YtfP
MSSDAPARRTSADTMHETAKALEQSEAVLHRSAEQAADEGTRRRLHALGDEVTRQAKSIGRRADMLSPIGTSDGALSRLATYGTLAPGRSNHDQLDGLDGRWLQGQVRGVLADAGWGAALGYPALVLDASAPAVDVAVFESADLPEHWARLDEFEGQEYERVVATVQTREGVVEASIYVLRPPD